MLGSNLTSWREQELIKGHALERWQPCRRLAHRESRRHELEPPELNRRHDKTVGHEPHSSLEVERRRQSLRVWNQIGVIYGIPPVEVVDFNSEEIIFVWTALLAHCALPDSCQCLCYCVRDATQHLCLLSALS